jgi:hypothetical protein
MEEENKAPQIRGFDSKGEDRVNQSNEVDILKDQNNQLAK